MANRFLGEITASAEGKTYTLRMDMNAMAEFEDATGLSALKVFDELSAGQGTITSMRAIVHAAMLRHHPEASLRDAGDLLSEDSSVTQRLMDAISPERGEVTKGKSKAGAKGPA